MQFILIFTITAVFPLLLYAQAVSDLFGLSRLVYDIIFRVWFLLWALAIAVFFWGLVKFIARADDAAEREKGRTLILWGVIALVVLVSVWGLVAFLTQSFGISIIQPVYRDKNGNPVY